MTIDQLLWDTSRAAALSAFFVLCGSVLTGQALRSALFGNALRNRELLGLHRFLTVCWLPLVGLHVLAITMDSVARISPLDVLVPFRVTYAPLAVGLGTLALDLLLIVTVSSYLRDLMDVATWRLLHRLSYLMFGLFVLQPAAGVIVFIAIATLARIAFGRLDQVRG
jgi:DMSO/TMAO reductase YedYZ heme-binding membrane subunit